VSTDYFVVYYGVRKSITPEEGEQMTEDETSLACRARHVGLDLWWSNFTYGEEEQYFLLVGREIGVYGAEHEYEKRLVDRDLLRIMEETRESLRGLQVEEEPALYLQWGPDF
jgi:hypothetical protein